MDSFRRLLEGTARCLARHEGRSYRRPVLAAVSGGVDSVVLAFVLARLHDEERLPGPVHVVHVDHGVRADSADNARFVVDLADRLDLPVHVRRLRPGGMRPSEDELRRARYDALAAVAAETRAGAVVTAHHADDNLETVLFRMLRGTGLRGLAGMPEVRTLGRGPLLLRPFLTRRRATLERIHEHYGLPVFEDSTNDDLGYARNHLRHVTIPALREEMGVGLDASLLVVSRTARSAAAIVEAQGRRVLSEWGRWTTPWRLDLTLEHRHREDDPFLEDALRQAHLALLPDRPAPLRSWLRRARALATAPAGRRIAGRPGRQGPGLLVERTRTGLLLVDLGRVPPLPTSGFGVAMDPDAGRTRFGASEWWLEAHRHPHPPLQPPPRACGRWRALVDARHAPRPWRLRRSRPGERFRPLGCAHDVDLRRCLQSRGIPRFDRDRLPLLVDRDDRVLWIPGVEIADDARVRLDGRATYEIHAHRG